MALKLAGGTVHFLPKDLRVVLTTNNKALRTWSDVTPLARNEWICWITSAKQDSTRARRLRIAIENLSVGKRRPCCWIGCPHR